MPTITIDGPPIGEMDTRRKLVRDMTDAAAAAYGLPRDIMVVLIRENQPQNVGVGGELISDRRRKEAES